MAIFNIDLTTMVQLGKDADGRLSVTAVQCVANVDNVDVQLEGRFRYRQSVDKERSTTKRVQADCDADVSPFSALKSWLYRSAVQHHLGDIRAEIEAKVSVSVRAIGPDVTQRQSAVLDLQPGRLKSFLFGSHRSAPRSTSRS